MPDFQSYKILLSYNQHFNSRLNAYNAYGRSAFASALGVYLVELEDRMLEFVALWNGSIALDPLPEGDPLPSAMQDLADQHEIPLTFAVDGTVSINV